jgi:hypothetical protein
MLGSIEVGREEVVGYLDLLGQFTATKIHGAMQICECVTHGCCDLQVERAVISIRPLQLRGYE